MSASQALVVAPKVINELATGRSISSRESGTRTSHDDHPSSSTASWTSWVPFYDYLNVPRYSLTADGWLIKRGHHIVAGPTRYYADIEISMKRSLIAAAP